MQLPDNTEFICPEVFGDKSWYFQKDTDTYFKIYNNNKEVYAKITGQNLPDPFQLEATRQKHKKALEDAGQDTTNHRVKCTTVTHKLWEHWNENKDG